MVNKKHTHFSCAQRLCAKELVYSTNKKKTAANTGRPILAGCMILSILLVGLLAGCSYYPYGEGTRFYALIIGIDNYPNLSEENQLNYCIKDARDLKTTLIEHGWQEGEITLLENAIRNEIITELNLIVEQAEAGDYMFVYYSGHGNRFPDTSGDETDGYDEAIIPSNYDGDTVGPILDDELGAIFSKARTQKGVFIFDSCFSGGVINKSITDPLLTSRYLNTRGTSGSSGTGDMDVASFPVMTASSQNEESYESSKLEHGIFTYTLLEAISGLNADANSDGHITIRELFDYAEDNTEYIAEYYFGVSQHPKLRFIGDFVDILVTR